MRCWTCQGWGRLLGALCLPWLVLAQACAEPSIALSLDTAEKYADRVAFVSVSVVVPVTSVDCDDVAFGSLSQEAFDASTIAQVSGTSPASVDISGIPRLGTKLIVMRAFDSSGEPLVAACETVETIDDELDVVLTAEPVVSVAAGETALGAPLPDVFPVLVADIDGDPVMDLTVSWTVVGAQGRTTVGMETTNADGVVRIEPEPVMWPGPNQLYVHARWERSPLPPVVGFVDGVTLLDVDLPGIPRDAFATNPDQLYQVGAIGPSGEPGFVALGPLEADLQSREALVGYFDAIAQGFSTATTPTLTNIFTIGSVASGSRDQVFGLTPTTWVDIGPDGSLTPQASPVPGNIARRILPVGDCDGPGNDVVVASFSNDSYAALDATASQTSSAFIVDPPTARMTVSGCVDDIGGIPRRAVVFSDPDPTKPFAHVLRAQLDVMRQVAWSTSQLGQGFASPPVGASFLLGNRITISGTSISRYRLLPINNNLIDFELVASDPIATLSLSTAAGDVDGDGLLDVVALLDLGRSSGEARYQVMTILGVEHEGQRVVGLSGTLTANDTPMLAVHDFDGDGIDDLLVGTPQKVSVFAMGVAP